MARSHCQSLGLSSRVTCRRFPADGMNFSNLTMGFFMIFHGFSTTHELYFWHLVTLVPRIIHWRLMYLDASGCMLIMYSQKLVEHVKVHATFYSITAIRMERWPFLGLVEDSTCTFSTITSGFVTLSHHITLSHIISYYIMSNHLYNIWHHRCCFPELESATLQASAWTWATLTSGR